jgi:hypothetical protein
MPPSTARFALESHTGAYENWPAKSRLLVDGALTELRLPGYSLLHQFEIGEGYLLVTDYDCAYEEATNFILLNRDLSILSSQSIGAPYCSFLLNRIEWLDERNFIAVFYQNDRWKVSIARRGIPHLRPQLSIKQLRNL